MLNKGKSNFKLENVLLILFLIAFFIRFPFIFRDYIDRDESTFILMGQSWVDGHLPYTELWDIKPPLTFFFFAMLIYLFGKSLIAIRLAGVILVVISSFFSYKISLKFLSKKIALIVGLLSIILQSLFGSLQGVMSEHIAMAFFMPALYLLTKQRKTYLVLLSGLLMGISVMVKLNMAYTILFIGVYLLYKNFNGKDYTKGVLQAIAYGTGIIFIILLTILPYYFQDNTSLWYSSVIEAPLDYIGARRYSLIKLAPLFIVLGVFLVFTWKRKLLDFNNSTIQLVVVAILGVLFAFYKGGRINGHYLIQLHPILLILVVITINKTSFFKKIKWKPYFMVFLFLIPIESYVEYINIFKNKLDRNTFFNGEGISVPKYILDNNLETKNILFLGYHIGYWTLGTRPPTKAATHPSNIIKDEMFSAYDNPRETSMEELRFLMEVLQPKTIVTRKNKKVFDIKEEEENIYIDTYLAKHYKVISVVEKAEILQRLER